MIIMENFTDSTGIVWTWNKDINKYEKSEEDIIKIEKINMR